MGVIQALIWISLPFMVALTIVMLHPRRRRMAVEVWSDDQAVWKRREGQTVDCVLWDEVKRVSVSQRENAYGTVERTYLLTTRDEVEHEFSASTIREEFLQKLRSLPGFEWEGFCEAIDASYPRTVICWNHRERG